MWLYRQVKEPPMDMDLLSNQWEHSTLFQPTNDPYIPIVWRINLSTSEQIQNLSNDLFYSNGILVINIL